MSRHTCHARNCDTPVPRSMFMCRKHWYMLTREMRAAVWREYVPGQENRMDPTPEYLEVTRVAIEYIAERERGR